jgi:hypothetical protein
MAVARYFSPPMNAKGFFANPRTSLAGCCMIAAAILTVLAALLDGDPSTMPDWAIAGTTIVSGVGLLFASDAKPQPPS